jgi:hypothetical protein
MLVMRLIYVAAQAVLIVFCMAVIVFASGLGAWVWLAFGPGAG